MTGSVEALEAENVRLRHILKDITIEAQELLGSLGEYLQILGPEIAVAVEAARTGERRTYSDAYLAHVEKLGLCISDLTYSVTRVDDVI